MMGHLVLQVLNQILGIYFLCIDGDSIMAAQLFFHHSTLFTLYMVILLPSLKSYFSFIHWWTLL